jgi:hypothetical protein
MGPTNILSNEREILVFGSFGLQVLTEIYHGLPKSIWIIVKLLHQIKPQLLPSSSFPIYYLLIISAFATYISNK